MENSYFSRRLSAPCECSTHRKYILRNTQRLAYFHQVSTKAVETQICLRQFGLLLYVKHSKPFPRFSQLWLRFDPTKPNVEYSANWRCCVFDMVGDKGDY